MDENPTVEKNTLIALFEKRRWLAIPTLLAAILAALLALSSVKPVVFIVLFAVHIATCFFLRPLKNAAGLGIELVMLITVLGSFAYGAKIGALLWGTAMLLDYAASMRFSLFSPVTITAYALTGLLAGNFSHFGITAVGIAATIIYNLATSFIIMAFMGGHIEKCARFGISDLAVNIALFTTIAPFLAQII